MEAEARKLGGDDEGESKRSGGKNGMEADDATSTFHGKDERDYQGECGVFGYRVGGWQGGRVYGGKVGARRV